MTKNRHWHGHAPGMAYAVTLYVSCKRDALAALREFLGVKRLPAGSAVWSNH